MNIVVLDAIESEHGIKDSLKEVFEERKETYKWFKINDYKIESCKSCGACGIKSPGKCVIQDDAPIILKEVAQCESLIFLTPIRFGGYSSLLKKILDRLIIVGTPFYTVHKGHMVHPMRYDLKWLFGLGISENNGLTQEDSFKTLVANNALNISASHKALTFQSSGTGSAMKDELRKALNSK